MNDTNNTPEIETTAPAAVVPIKVELTKEQRLAAISAQIVKLQERLYNIENDIVVAKVVKVVALPEVGADVLFMYGRKTATTQPVERLGRVVAVKPSIESNGKKLPAQIKVQLGEGFDAEYAVIYPAQVLTPGAASE